MAFNARVFEEQGTTLKKNIDEAFLKKQDGVILYSTQTVKVGRMFEIILTLPLNPIWNFWVVFTCTLNFLALSMCAIFFPEYIKKMMVIYGFCDLIYFVSWILITIHQYSTTLKERMQTVRVNKFLHFLDFSTFFCQEMLAFWIFGGDSLIPYIIRWVTLIRLRHLKRIYGLNQEVLDNRLSANFLIAGFTLIMLVHVSSCFFNMSSDDITLFFNVSYYQGNNSYGTEVTGFNNLWFENEWSETAISNFPYYRNASGMSWYFLDLYTSVDFLFNVGTGVTKPENPIEMIAIITFMILGYVLLDLYFLVSFYRILTILNKNEAYYQFRIESINLYLQDVNISRRILRNIKQYFVILWEKKDGVKSSAHFFYLPPSLQMEIMYDINCMHIYRSLLFFDLMEFYLRTLAQLMRHEFVLPGDVMYHQGVVKRSMLVISKGILEILSDEDDESPIIAFKAGTVLGESCLFLSLPAKATVRAAVYSEVKIIDRVEFIRRFSNHPVALACLRQRVLQRINRAKQNIVFTQNTIHLELKTERRQTPIKALKTRLLARDKKANEQLLTSRAETTHVREQTNILSLYNLSTDDSNVEIPVLFLTYTFPWIVDSNSSLVTSWEHLILIVHMMFLTIYAYYISFERTLPFWVKKEVKIGSDFICVVDIILLTVTSVILKDRVLCDFKSIVKYHAKTVDFYMYVIPVFPYEILLLSVDDGSIEYSRLYDLVSFIKILRLWRCYKISIHLEIVYGRNLYVKSVRLIVMVVLFVYLGGCCIFLWSCLYETCTEDSWFYALTYSSVEGNQNLPCFNYPFATSVYFATSLMLKIGFGDIKVVLPTDMFIALFYIVVGYIFITYIKVSLAASISASRTNSESFQQEYFSFQRFLANYKVPTDSISQVKKFFMLQWLYDRRLGRTSFEELAPTHLKMAVNKAELLTLLTKVPLFQYVDVDFLMDVALSSQIRIIHPGCTVYYAGDVDREMYIIQKGSCAVFDIRGNFVKHITEGAYFGVIEMLFNMSKSATIRTITNCKLIHITFRSFSSSLSMFPVEMDITNRSLQNEELLKSIDLIEQKKMIFITEKRAAKAVRIKQGIWKKFKKSFIFVGRCYKDSKNREKYWDPFRKMGKWQIVGMILMPISIRPTSFALKAWVIFRIVIMISNGLTFPMRLGLPPATSFFWLIGTTSSMTSFIEIYLFFHIAFYNQQGILVTHPKYTARHYLTHGFAIDVFTAFPIWYFGKFLPKHGDKLDKVAAPFFSHQSYCILRMASLLQWHRILGLVNYFDQDVLSKKSVYGIYIVLALVLVLHYILTTLNIPCTYYFTKENQNGTYQKVIRNKAKNITLYGTLSCDVGAWIDYIKNDDIHGAVDYVAMTGYWFLNTFSLVGLGDATPFLGSEMLLTVTIAIISVFLTAYALAVIHTSSGKGSNAFLDYQEKVQELLRFLRKENMPENKIDKVFHYYEYVWHRTMGMENLEMLSELTSSLRGDISLFIYEKTLRAVPIFRRLAKPYLKVIAKHLKEQYFLRGDMIIRSYDVHSTVYIILRGSIEIISPYDEHITSINVGGIFGNLRQAAAGCSFSTFVALRNVDALTMSSEEFYQIAQEYPPVKNALTSGLKNATDFVLPAMKMQRSVTQSEDYEMDQYEESEIASRMSAAAELKKKAKKKESRIVKLPRNKCLVCLLFFRPRTWFRFALDPDHIIFQVMRYVVVIVSIYQVWLIPYMFMSQTYNPFIYFSTLILEPVFYVRILFIMHEAYLDSFGIYVRRFKMIATRYFSDNNRVFWDFIPNLPLFIFSYFANTDNRFAFFTTLRLFHLLRWKYVFQAFELWSAPLLANRALILISKTFIIFLSTIHYTALIALMIFQIFGKFERVSTSNNIIPQNPFDKYMYCLYYMGSIFTRTGVGDIYPQNHPEFIFTICMIILALLIYGLMIGCCLQMFRITLAQIFQYEYNVNILKQFLINQGVSTHLLDKLWTYIKQIWHRDRGTHMPELLLKAPYVMRCDMMKEIYLKHLKNSYLFKDINNALITQICGHLKRIVYFKGNYILQNGDTNASMYWIHRGEVSVLTVHANLTETQHAKLSANDTFGFAQGLIYGLPFIYSYRAETHCDILVLKLETWEHILHQFPQDAKTIYTRMWNIYTIV